MTDYVFQLESVLKQASHDYTMYTDMQSKCRINCIIFVRKKINFLLVMFTRTISGRKIAFCQNHIAVYLFSMTPLHLTFYVEK